MYTFFLNFRKHKLLELAVSCLLGKNNFSITEITSFVKKVEEEILQAIIFEIISDTNFLPHLCTEKILLNYAKNYS